MDKEQLFNQVMWTHIVESFVNDLFKDEQTSKGIVVADIDNTLVEPCPEIIGIYKTKNGKTEWLTCHEYDTDPDLLDDNPDVQWDYSDFYDPEKARESILQGIPILGNLEIIDQYIQMGYDFAFLTARSNEDVIKEALEKFLKYRDETGELKHLKNIFKKGFSAAIGDDKYIQVFGDLNAAQKKGKVLEYLCDKYDRVIFIDDSPKNLKVAKELGLLNLEIIEAKRN